MRCTGSCPLSAKFTSTRVTFIAASSSAFAGKSRARNVARPSRNSFRNAGKPFSPCHERCKVVRPIETLSVVSPQFASDQVKSRLTGKLRFVSTCAPAAHSSSSVVDAGSVVASAFTLVGRPDTETMYSPASRLRPVFASLMKSRNAGVNAIDGLALFAE